MAIPLHRITFTSLLILAACCVRSVSAQTPPDQSAAQQDLDQQMADIREQVLRNMLSQGMNPADFFDEVRKASPDGSFDLDVVRQKLVEKGLLDQQTIDRVQQSMQQVATGNLKQQLAVSDDEWKALQPKIQKVVDAAYAAGAIQQQRLMMLGFHPTIRGPSEVSKTLQDVRAVSKDPATKPEMLASKLETWRKTRQQAQEKYTTAQQELIEVLTRRQEAVLYLAGLLQ